MELDNSAFKYTLLHFLLTDPSHIKVYPNTTYEDRDGNVFCMLVAYKDARTDMEILDEVLSPVGWQNKYRRDSNGVLQCGIGVKFCEEWVWKWSNGVPTQIEKQKGEYSDAFKRAGYMWGIGRCLYTFPQMWVSLNDTEWYKDREDKIRIAKSFRPNDWKWDIDSVDGVTYWRVQAWQIINKNEVQRLDTNPYKKREIEEKRIKDKNA